MYHALTHLKQTRVKTDVASRKWRAHSQRLCSEQTRHGGLLRITAHEPRLTLIYPGFVTSEIRARALGADGQPLGRAPCARPR